MDLFIVPQALLVVFEHLRRQESRSRPSLLPSAYNRDSSTSYLVIVPFSRHYSLQCSRFGLYGVDHDFYLLQRTGSPLADHCTMEEACACSAGPQRARSTAIIMQINNYVTQNMTSQQDLIITPLINLRLASVTQGNRHASSASSPAQRHSIDMASVPLRNKRNIQRSQSVYLHSTHRTSLGRQHSVKDARARKPPGTVNVAINVSCRFVWMHTLTKCVKVVNTSGGCSYRWNTCRRAQSVREDDQRMKQPSRF